MKYKFFSKNIQSRNDFSDNVLISLKNIVLDYGNNKVLTNVSLEVNRNEIVTIIGPNGSGKTSLIRILTGLYDNFTGKKYVKKNIVIGYMPQKIIIDKIMPLTVRRFLRLTPDIVKLRKLDDVKEIASEIGILPLMDSQIHDISGGQMQRVLFARAILSKPDILILDEPAQGMDIKGQSEFYDLIVKIKQRLNCGILLISHDLHLVMSATDRVVCLNKHICCEGRPEDVSKHPDYLALFSNEKLDNVAIYTHHHDHSHSLDGYVKENENG